MIWSTLSNNVYMSARVKWNDKYNFIDTDGRLVSPNQWFDKVWFFEEGYAMVKLNGKICTIDTNGNISSNGWVNSKKK